MAAGPRPTGRAASSRSPMSRSTTAGSRSASSRRSRPKCRRFRPRRIITRNSSPDIGFDRSINPYRGCEHGCIYCFARPTHAFLGLSPGLDFETKLFAKTNAGAALERELADPAYRPRTIAIGTNTDPYQPIERRYRIMRRILEVLSAANHPVGIVTKSALVLRDLDILALHGGARSGQGRALRHHARPQARPRHGAAREHAGQAARDGRPSWSTRACRPRSWSRRSFPASPTWRWSGSSSARAAAGVKNAGYVLLRLPLEIGDLFTEWLEGELPGPRQPRSVADALDARRQALRCEVGRAHGGRGALCLDDRAPISRSPPSASASTRTRSSSAPTCSRLRCFPASSSACFRRRAEDYNHPFLILRHGRACPGHPRFAYLRRNSWMPGTRPGMTRPVIGDDANQGFPQRRRPRLPKRALLARLRLHGSRAGER